MSPIKLHAAAAGLLAALALLAAARPAAAAASAPRTLSCPPSVIQAVTSCTASGTVVAGANVTYAFSIEPEGPGHFDLSFVLRCHSGDADLVVSLPGGAERASKHGSGEDWVLVPRVRVAAGEYLVTVVGSADASSYTLTVEKNERRIALDAGERAALQTLADGPCCAGRGACASLRQGLSGMEGIAGDLCNTGVNRCDGQGRLLHLALVQEYLSCPFPSELAALTQLQLLDLTMNDLSGRADVHLASVVRALPSLQALHLGHNQLGGQLSCQLLGPQARLAVLDLSANQLEGTIPPCLVESPALLELYLSSNRRLGGTLPAPPPGSRLMALAAGNANLTGWLPDLRGAAQLQALRVQGNGLSGPLPALPGSIREANLEYNALTGTIPQQWGNLESWQVLRLRHNQLTGSLPPGLAYQTDLELLMLGFNGLSGPLPWVWHAPVLLRLDLQKNNFTGPLPPALGGLPALAVLQAHTNRLTGSLEPFVQAAVAGGSQVQMLDLKRNQLEGGVPADLQRLRPLLGGGFVLVDGQSLPATLDLSDNQLSGPFPAWLPQELVNSSVQVALNGNRLACPPFVPVSEPLPEYRVEGLECVAADGNVQSVASLLRLQPAPAPAGSPDAPAPVPDAAGTSGSSVMAGWAIALISLGSVAAAGAVAWLAGPALCGWWQAWRARRYQGYEDQQPSSPGAAYAAKAAAVAMSTLGGGGKKAQHGGGSSAAANASDAYGAWGSPAAPAASTTSAGEPFRIGTRVHADATGEDAV